MDVSAKAETTRAATAQVVLGTRPEPLALLAAGNLPKGDGPAASRVAGIMEAKATPQLIPLCHPLPPSKATVDAYPGEANVWIEATVKTHSVTGVEMEALTAAAVAAVSLDDMVKTVDKHAVISDIKVLGKPGGKSGDWPL